MRINELPLIADFSATDYAGVDNGTATRKINLAGIINGIKTRLTAAETNVSNKVDKSDALLNLDTTQAATTVDGALYAAIVALGWESEVITSA